MKIAICIKNFGCQGGQENFNKLLAQYLVARGHGVEILTTVAGACLPGAAVRVAKTRRAIPRSARDWAAGRALARQLNADRPDVALGEQKTWHCEVLRPGGGVEDEYWISRLAWRYARPLPPGLRYLSLKHFFDVLAERNGYHSPFLRCVIANSELVRRTLLRHYPRLNGRIEVVSNGADTERFHPRNARLWRQSVAQALNLKPELFTAIFVGHDFLRKGLRCALEAVALARQRNAPASLRLLVVGGGNPRPYQRIVADLGLASAVTFCGDTDQPERYYAAADCLLLPTFYDPCANVVAEALASGLPVLTTSCNGAAELIRHGQNGWIADRPQNLAALAGFLGDLTDQARLAQMKQAARETALQHQLATKLARVESILLEKSRPQR